MPIVTVGHSGASRRRARGGVRLRVGAALLPDGWASDVVVTVDAGGQIAAVERAMDLPRVALIDHSMVNHVCVPGVPNVHCHAFQRVMAGRAERSSHGADTFWSWRSRMYELANRIEADELERVATRLYRAMVRLGYTHVVEFHYLHHDSRGRPYVNPAELCERITVAAGAAGIGLTLLPVLYQYSDFGRTPPLAEQRRFCLTTDRYAALLEGLVARHRDDRMVRIGGAPHSLRAVDGPELLELVRIVRMLDGLAPIHIHISEQEAEVQACVERHGTTPIEWLLDAGVVDSGWCLVHGTHATTAELTAAIALKVPIGVCVTTEANLGDGAFPTREFRSLGGLLGVGSDSNISLSPPEELRWLEYQARLRHRQRNVLADEACSVGRALLTWALEGGSRASGCRIGAIAPGYRADLLFFDREDSRLSEASTPDEIVDMWVFRVPTVGPHRVMTGGLFRC